MMQILSVVVGVLAVAGVAYVLWRPQWAAVLVIAMFPLEQLLQSYLQILRNVGWLFNVIVGSVALFGVISRFFQRERVVLGYKNPVTVMVAGLWFVAFIGMFFTPSKESAGDLIRMGMPYHILMLGLLPMLVADIREMRRVLTGLMVLGIILSILIMVNPSTSYYAGRMVLDLGMYAGQRGAAGNPLALAEFGAMVAMIAALIRFERATAVLNLVRVAAFILGLGLAVGSGSRGQVLAAIVTGVLFYPVARRVANPKQFILSVVGFGAVLGGVYLVFSLFIGEQNEERWALWRMFQDITSRFELVWSLMEAYITSPAHWVLGLGPNAFTAYYPAAQPGEYVHNVAAEVFFELGLAGGALFTGALINVLRYARRSFAWFSTEPSMRSVVALLAALCAYDLFLALKQGCFIGAPQPFPTWFLLAKLARREEIMIASGAVAEPGPDEEDEPEDHEAYALAR